MPVRVESERAKVRGHERLICQVLISAFRIELHNAVTPRIGVALVPQLVTSWAIPLDHTVNFSLRSGFAFCWRCRASGKQGYQEHGGNTAHIDLQFLVLPRVCAQLRAKGKTPTAHPAQVFFMSSLKSSTV